MTKRRKLTTHDYHNPADEFNGPQYHTGKLCIEGCGRPAGTAWSPLWCQPCNVIRMDRIRAKLERLK
jgi:hypothetical protein